MTRYFIDSNGVFLGGFDGAEPPAGAIEIFNNLPADGRDRFIDGQWVPYTDPDIPGFFDGLVKAIISGALPGDVHAKALMVKDLKDPADQAAALGAFSSDPVYTKEQKQLLDALIKSTNLALPDVPGAE